jgi:hypothetical protein
MAVWAAITYLFLTFHSIVEFTDLFTAESLALQGGEEVSGTSPITLSSPQSLLLLSIHARIA